jgi:hypothetical protein
MVKDKGEQEIIFNALEEWQDTGLLTAADAEKLRATVVIRKSERQQLAHYFFIIAASCTLLAFGALFLDEKVLEKLQRTFLLQNITIAAGSGILAAVCFWQALKRKSRISSTIFEIYLIPGALTALISLVYFCKDWGNGASYTLFLGLAALLFFGLSTGFRSLVLWVGLILAAMGWFGAFSTAFGHDYLFLGMNYPVRFTVFGLVMLAGSYAQQLTPRLAPMSGITWHAGLLVFLTGLWGVSVFGNFNHLDEWQAVRQTRVLGYALLSGLITGGLLWFGIRTDNRPARDYGILFVLLNLYTRYFEYFWDAINKGLSFLILALSFGLLGWWLSSRKDVPAG